MPFRLLIAIGESVVLEIDRVDREFATGRFRTMTNRVNIVPYDPDWPRRFDEERRILAAAFAGSDTMIEHVGSTAVPGLGAKPVIDVLIGVPLLAEVEHRAPALEAVGYEYVQEYERQLPDRRYFRKPRLGRRAFHVHCVVTGGDFWIRHLAFRDYLRAHPESAAAYYELKRDLALRVSKEEYTEAKTPFIAGILASAMCHREDQEVAQSGVEPRLRWKPEYSITCGQSKRLLGCWTSGTRLRVSAELSPKATQMDVFQSVWYRLALLFCAVYLTVLWFDLGPSNPWYALMVAWGTSSLQPVLAGPLMRRLRRQWFRVPDGERVLHQVLGVGLFWRVLDVIGWNRQITRMRAFSGTKAGLVSLEQSARAGAVAHGICFAIHVVLAVCALFTNHPWSGALWMLLPTVMPHVYPVLMQRAILLRLQPLLDQAAARRPISN